MYSHTKRMQLSVQWYACLQKKGAGDFKCTMPPDFVIPHGLSTLYRCSLTTLAQYKPYREKPFIRDCCNQKGSCTIFRPYRTSMGRSSFWILKRLFYLPRSPYMPTQLIPSHFRGFVIILIKFYRCITLYHVMQTVASSWYYHNMWIVHRNTELRTFF